MVPNVLIIRNSHDAFDAGNFGVSILGRAIFLYIVIQGSSKSACNKKNIQM